MPEDNCGWLILAGLGDRFSLGWRTLFIGLKSIAAIPNRLDILALRLSSTMRRNLNAKAMVRRPRQNSRKQNGSARRSSAMDLPQLSPRTRVTKKFRLAATADQASIGVTTLQLLGLCGCVATSAVSASAIASAVKVESVELWGTPAFLANSSTVSVTWTPSDNSLSSEQSDTAVSPSRPAHMRSVPPNQSLASFWHSEPAVSANLFTFILPQGGVCDITVSFQIKDTEVNSPFVGVGLTVGSFYNKNLSPTLKHVSLQNFD
jgi:hypothetical protein